MYQQPTEEIVNQAIFTRLLGGGAMYRPIEAIVDLADSLIDEGNYDEIVEVIFHAIVEWHSNESAVTTPVTRIAEDIRGQYDYAYEVAQDMKDSLQYWYGQQPEPPPFRAPWI